MRIALLTHQFPGARMGGIGAYTLHAARALTAADHDVHVFTFTLPPDVRGTLPANIILHEVDDLAARAQKKALAANLLTMLQSGSEAMYRLAMGALLCDALRQVHNEIPFDVVEAPEYEALALPLMLDHASNVPIVTHLHSASAVQRLAMNLPQTSEQLLLEALEFAAIALADARCAPSRQVVLDTREAAPIGEVEVIPLPYFTETPIHFSQPNPAAPLLFIGRLEFIKGAHLLPEAFNQFLANHASATVRLAGPDTLSTPDNAGSMQKYIQTRLSPAIRPRVHFLGELPRHQLAAELAACSAVIVPSLFESYSYVCCEALAAGRPVIVSTSIGATEVVADAGIPFPRGDATALAAALAQLADNPPLLQKLAERAHHRSHNELSPKFAVEKRIRFYEQTIRDYTPGPRSLDRLKSLPAHHLPLAQQAIAQLTGESPAAPATTAQSPGRLLTRIMENLSPSGGARIVLYGAGRHTSRLLAQKHLWESRGHQVIGIIDDHPRFREIPTHLGLPVESLDTFAAKTPSAQVAVVLSTDTFTERFWENTAPLRAKGIPVFRLYP